jgi:hypothetical protein
MVRKSWLKTGVAGALAALGVVSVTAGSASAYVACNRYGECWHARTRLVYPRSAGIVFHPDGWRFGGRGYRWAGDHPGRGYWRHGVWVTF